MKKIKFKRFNSIPEMFGETADKNHRKVAIRYFKTKDDNIIIDLTWGQYKERAFNTAAGLIKLGFRKGDHIAILSETRYEWCIADIGILSIGASTTTIFPTLGFDQVRFILADSDNSGVFLSNWAQLEKILRIWGGFKSDEVDKEGYSESGGGSGKKETSKSDIWDNGEGPVLSKLKYVIVFDDLRLIEAELNKSNKKLREIYEARKGQIITLSELQKLGSEFLGKNPNAVREAIAKIKEDDLASIIYTSGTTGIPKGVMLTHKNFISDIIMGAMALDYTQLPDQVSTTYLPLSHSFTRTVEHFGACYFGATLCFAKNYDNLAENINDFKPTAMIGVPYVFEQIYHRVLNELENMPPKAQKIFWDAIKFGKKYIDIEQQGKKPPFLMRLRFNLNKALIFSKIKKKLGGKLERFLSGAAPLNPEIAKFFAAAGIYIYEGYGLTESAPVTHCNRMPCTTNVRPSIKIGTVGPVVGWTIQGNVKNPYEPEECKISEDGEILIRGPNIMKGYYNRPEETAEALDSEGWLHTGDKGEIDKDGYLKIIGRMKEIIVLRTGKKVAPNLVEHIYEDSEFVEQIMLLGEGEKYITALVVPDFSKKEKVISLINKDLNRNNKAVQSFSADISNEKFCNNELVIKFFEKEMKQIEEGKLSHYESVKKFKLIPEPFSEENGLLTPTLKKKRAKIADRYFNLIKELYE
ncbi:MAG: AMP-dependent synthetase/ligase [Promethearchaeota archaeon]